MEGQENVVLEDSNESYIHNKTKKNLEKEISNYNITSPNNPLYDLIERQAKEFEEFGKRMSSDLQNFYKEYLNRQKGINKAKNGYSEIEKVCKEFEEKIVLQSQVIESLKARIEELETDSIVKDQDIKFLRNELNESVKILSEQDNEKNQRRDSLTDQFSEILNMADSVNETNEDGAIFLHETIETRSGSTVLRCKECGKNFKNHVRFMFHAKERHQYKWLCLVCFQVFLSGRDRGVHMRRNHKKEYSCTLCTKSCYDITGLREHFRAKHPGSTFSQTQSSVPSQPSIIPQPSIQSRSSFLLRSQPIVSLSSVPSQSTVLSQPIIPPTPPQTVVGKFVHEIIPYKFPTKKMPPYQLKCKICEEIFSTYALFIKHAKSLHGYKLLCTHCCQLFSQKALRNKHMREDHIYCCQICNKQFRSADGLISHCRAKKHNVDGAIKSVYSKLRENHPAQEDNLVDHNFGKITTLVNDDNVKENQIQEEDEVNKEVEKESGDDSDLFDSFDDDDDDDDDEGSVDNGDDVDDGVNFPKCEECQLYFRDNKQLEKHNIYHYQNIF
ncbi:hypothetical protein RclHR1_05180011 [Rhizophagus clarus]|uniref:Zinc finger protein 709-like n=1 Tax=Rhizophagus clarus TaxID=94130 RepID=A0A2Z6RM91_9GLOM|nr:hypothetical protein RclHR1_05180011 [Rhizophagus clarus]GES82842.1 zinc finger protein 709-like [Rhizophagus clarus]